MKTLLLVLCFMSVPWVHATDLGVLGNTFVISEMDFMEYLQNKIKTMQKHGEWDKVQNQFKNRVKAQINRPTPLYLPRAIEDKTWVFNPSITVPYDVTNVQGAVIIPKGTVVNPLDRVGLSSTLLFFNGDDEEQVAWAVQEQKKYAKVKLILTSGSIQETVNQLKQAIYFDLNGFLCGKFKITHLPARVMQAGNRLQINEVHL
ncbi:TPA: type-F conjugative transfer system protein TraW [Legionella pneumophila]